MKSSLEIATESLKANIMTLPSGKFLTAGQNQFLTLWTRDFCHAVRGLITLKEYKVVEDHLSFLLKTLRESDGLVPRVIDNHMVQFRVAYQSQRRMLPFLPRLSFKEPLKPQYIDEHGSFAYDSNLLLLMAALLYKKTPAGSIWWSTHEHTLKKVFAWYENKFENGLIKQTPFADWQDTTNRQGKTFITNLFYFLTATRLKSLGWDVSQNLSEMKTKMQDLFFEKSTGVYLSLGGYPQVSIEANLMVLEAEEFLSSSEKEQLWKDLKRHPIIALDGVIGRASVPDWPHKDLAFHVKLANLHRYHGELNWSWLMGLGLRICQLMNDQEMEHKQLSHINRLLQRDGDVQEVYDPRTGFNPWGSWLIKAEHPFAWGSGYLVEALSFSLQKV